MFRNILAVSVFLVALLGVSQAKAFDNPLKENHVWVPGMQFHMAYDPSDELFMMAPGLHFYTIGHKTALVLGGSFAYFANEDYSMGTFETIIGYDVTADADDVHLLLSSGLGFYGYGNAGGQVATLSLPMKVHLDFSDDVLIFLGSRLYHDFWDQPFVFDFGISGGF